MTPQQTWSTGDFSMVGSSIVIVSEMLCESVEVHAGDRVLDVATGSGNTALAAARRACRVSGIDFVPALLERARERAAAERLKIEFQEGAAESIPFPDGSFDVVLSTFGAMFAEPRRAASEMLRVCRSGGKIGMANWTPQGFVGEWSRVSARFTPPPPPDFQPPALWGVREIVQQRFGDAVREVRLVERQVRMRHHTPESWVEFMKKYFGPIMVAHQAAGERAPELTAAMVEMAKQHNRSGDATLLLDADYVEVIAVKA
ncbi:MAG TPA: class I SAM-dependent methyltransferase [Bryobacteraceae bacterium]|jgi:ubiquinone/menaquinone biosynthesis C-methylase UbiE|nr:class I SAM-dependent methyltransferase [Bryobacteraceae bacterium]